LSLPVRTNTYAFEELLTLQELTSQSRKRLLWS
jgi:hypothetical protein